MSTFNWCKGCDGYHWTNTACLPRWDIWRPDYDEARADAATVAGSDAKDAVERWAERDDARGDYDIIGGSPATVLVAPEGAKGPVQRFRVTGEPVPSYSAKQLPDEGTPA